MNLRDNWVALALVLVSLYLSGLAYWRTCTLQDATMKAFEYQSVQFGEILGSVGNSIAEQNKKINKLGELK